MSRYAGYFFIFIATGCWGFLGIFGRLAMETGMEPVDVAFWRALIGGICLFLHAVILKQARIQNKSDLFGICIFGMFSIACFFACYQYAVKEGGAALASVLLYTAPAWVAIFSRFFLGLKFTLITCIAVGLALLGCSFIALSPQPADVTESIVPVISQENTTAFTSSLPLLGIAFGTLSGFLYATHFIVTKKLLLRYSPFTLYGYGHLVAALCLLPFIDLRLDLGLKAWLALLGLSVVGCYIAYWAYCEAIRRLHPTKVAVLATFEPLVAIFAAWYIWGESFSFLGWIGAVLIISTVIIFLIDDNKRKSTTNENEVANA